MNLERLNRITVEEGKCGGRPCIRGLRMRVKDVLELLSAGASFEEILKDYRSWNGKTSLRRLIMPPANRPRRSADVKFLIVPDD